MAEKEWNSVLVNSNQNGPNSIETHYSRKRSSCLVKIYTNYYHGGNLHWIVNLQDLIDGTDLAVYGSNLNTRPPQYGVIHDPSAAKLNYDVSNGLQSYHAAEEYINKAMSE